MTTVESSLLKKKSIFKLSKISNVIIKFTFKLHLTLNYVFKYEFELKIKHLILDFMYFTTE